jgi:hypothetical protein
MHVVCGLLASMFRIIRILDSLEALGLAYTTHKVNRQ